jgi:hypothetical protein
VNGGLALRVAELSVGVARRLARSVPAGVRKNLEDRLFYVIFQRTRVENDAYGWRPDERDHRRAAG